MSEDSEVLDNLLARAQRSFEVAEGLLKGTHADFAAPRAYYCCFYTAEALLPSECLSYSRHPQVVAQFGHHFAKTGELNARYHRLLKRTRITRSGREKRFLPLRTSTWSDDDAAQPVVDRVRMRFLLWCPEELSS